MPTSRRVASAPRAPRDPGRSDVLLLETPFFTEATTPEAKWYSDSKYNLALLALGTYVRAHSGYDVRLVNMVKDGLELDDVLRLLRDARPRVLGVPIYSFNFGLCYAYLARIKQEFPELHVCVGGPHAAIYPRETVALEHVDSVVLGDGEVPFLGVCEAVIERGGLDAAALPPGTYTKASLERGVALTAFRHPNLDDLPLPDLTLLGDYRRYRDFLSNRTMGILTTSRGCPYVCHYCWSEKSTYRHVSIEKVIDTMRVYRDMGVEYVEFWDETFNPNKKRLREFADALLDADLGLTWSIRGAVVNHVEYETMVKLRRAGLRIVQFGVETGDPELLKFMNKRTSRELVGRALETCRRAGLRTVTNMIVGIPGQTRAQVLADFQMLRELRPTYVAVNVYNWAPGTTHYARALESGTLREDKWRTFAERPDPRFSIYYYENPLISYEELCRLRDRFVLRYYFNPSYLADYVRRMHVSEVTRAAQISTLMLTTFVRKNARRYLFP